MKSFDYKQYRRIEYEANEFDKLKECWLNLKCGKDIFRHYLHFNKG